MYDVMAVAGAVWSYPYAWKGPALVTLGREINENKRLRERIGVAERGFVTSIPSCISPGRYGVHSVVESYRKWSEIYSRNQLGVQSS